MSHPLFQPHSLGSLILKNRILMAPMTRCRARVADEPSALMAEYYAQRASAGLIISEGIPVSTRARGYLWTPGIYTPAQVEGWKGVAEAVHGAGGLIFAQIWHVGRISHQSLQPPGAQPEGPSDEQPEGAVCFALDEQGTPGNLATSRPQAMDAAALQRVRSEFVNAAESALAAGMDGVEIHAANGYLFDQFLNSRVNTRTDGYGGNPENRSRFVLEVVDAVTSAIGADRVGVRISPNGRFNAMPEDPEMEATFLYLSSELSRRGIAYLHINDQATFGMPAIPPGLVELLRGAFSGCLVLCGGYDADKAKQAIESGLADLVAFGVPFLANPDLPARMEHGWPLNEADRDSFYGGDAKGYTDYPCYEQSE